MLKDCNTESEEKNHFYDISYIMLSELLKLI